MRDARVSSGAYGLYSGAGDDSAIGLYRHQGAGTGCYVDGDAYEENATKPMSIGWLIDAMATIYEGTAHPGDADAVIQRLSNHS